MEHFDVIIVGGGHAGVEAAAAAARIGVRVALLTHNLARIGEMSCNPAIGGLGKGHLVREIDALDGLIGRIGDRAAIQYRLLNRRKGPAVQGPRSQIDRALYRKFMQAEIANIQNLTLIESAVDALILSNGKCMGVQLSDGTAVTARNTVLTTGTFLGGVLHIGTEKKSGGRTGDPAANVLAQQLRSFDLPIGRLKTGTPPRLNGKTIDWTHLEMQPADDTPTVFSFLNTDAEQEQISCGITHTNEKTHDIIRENLHLSAMYSGNITGTGPRYCPSIEDKVGRFADKNSHQVFLEPEGINDDTIYPNGISTSLPIHVQESYLHSMVGLENVEILQPGYAIEYDYIDPRALNKDFSLNAIANLFLAGQINGTTGYEEAAAQGLVAGANAALASFDNDPIIFGREQAYIGVLVDDLTRTGVSEPYRMFTSRAEYRLSLRADNADQRLTQIGADYGLVGDARMAAFSAKRANLEHAKKCLDAVNFTPNEYMNYGIRVNTDGKRRSLWDLLATSDYNFDDVKALNPDLVNFSPSIIAQVEIEAQYSSYIERQKVDIAAIQRDRSVKVPVDMSFDAMPGLSNELKNKLKAIRPKTLADAAAIEGMTPAALSLLAINLRRRHAG